MNNKTLAIRTLMAVDAYKLDHRRQYPLNTTRVYSNFTPRGSRVPGVDRVVFFGLQAFLKGFLGDGFNAFFAADEDEIVDLYVARVNQVLGPNEIGGEHIRALHRLGYVPLRFNALPEGTLVPLRVPMFTVENTHDDFFWLVNYIETALSASLWLPCTSATTAHHMRKMLDDWAVKTSSTPEFVDWQGHDFSFRGMSNIDAAAASGAGHLLSFKGTDTLPAIDFIDEFYPGDNGLIGGSVPATEHSVMCAGGNLHELETFRRLLKLYPSGTVAIVSDTWSLWDVCAKYLPILKDEILARPGKVVIRPDSGNPADIICGLPGLLPGEGSAAGRGVADLLWDLFGGTTNGKGYKELDSHIGMIYGDSINYDRADEICARLADKGFASTNMVDGMGSYGYQYVTRDTYNFAVKATWAKVDGVDRDLFKDPATDDGAKKSAKGRLAVLSNLDNELYLKDNASQEDEAESLLETVWEDGKFIREQSFADIRELLRAQ